MWVVANYKETQLPGIAVGKKVEIEVDAISKETFHGTVNSLQAGTGAAFTLLPPDNATGNFTKVVQRVPVKILFDAGQKNLDQLRSGMSASAVVDLGGS
jgi:membrane fusion protein (multidrug efflux system)